MISGKAMKSHEICCHGPPKAIALPRINFFVQLQPTRAFFPMGTMEAEPRPLFWALHHRKLSRFGCVTLSIGLVKGHENP